MFGADRGVAMPTEVTTDAEIRVHNGQEAICHYIGGSVRLEAGRGRIRR